VRQFKEGVLPDTRGNRLKEHKRKSKIFRSFIPVMTKKQSSMATIKATGKEKIGIKV
jgi:hypothetical protein